MKNLKKIKGDASFRKFFRKKNNNYNSIIVFTKKEKIKNLLIYDSINKILNKNKVLAPQLYNEYYHKDYIEIQDFGDDTIYRIFKKKVKSKIYYFKKIVETLIKIQLIKDKNIKNFKKKNFKVPKYDNKILVQEANLFCDWYVQKNLKKSKREKFIKKFKKIIKKLSLSLKLKNNTFVHRDFHISNLILVNNKIGVLDSQDASIGNQAYDLASLIDDVRFRTSELIKNKVLKLYLDKQKKLNNEKFKNDFEILSILRNLKIIGIFTRLAVRDKKKFYLKLIPHAWSLISMRISKNEIFGELKELLSSNFNRKLNGN